MKRLGLGLATVAALSALTLAMPGAAWAQRLKSSGSSSAPAADAKPTKISDADKVRGAKEAPSLVAASDVKSCQVTDSAYRGGGTQKSADGKASKVTLYEVACQTGPGYLVAAQEGGAKPQMINCIIAAQGATKCALPGNLDANAALAGYVRAAGRTCDVSGQRYVGSSASGLTYYEVACGGGSGFLLAVNDTAAGSKPEVTDCQALQGSPQACQLTTKTQILAAYQPAVAKSGRACPISDTRPIGSDPNSGDIYTEIACTGAPGFMLQQDRAGVFKAAIDCDRAERIGGGCKLTDAKTVAAGRTADYTKLAAKAGFPCQVSTSRYVGLDASHRDVVELACSDRPDGAVAAFSDTGRSDVYDCVRARALGGQSCTLTQPAAIYPHYTELVSAKSNGGCKVSDAKFVGSLTTGPAGKTDYVETACASGIRGFVIAFKSGTGTASDVLTCTKAADAGLPCELKPNLPVNK